MLLNLMNNNPICLASQSKSRKEVLEGVKFRFDMQPADIDESNNGEVVDDYVMRLSKEKAMAVLPENQSKIVVAADSVSDFDGEIIGKPKSREEAIRTIMKLEGKWHTFVTGLCVIRVSDGKIIQKTVKTRVKFSPISLSECELYVDTIGPYSYAGAFSNTESSWFIEKLEGSFTNIVGLPMAEFFGMLKELGFTLSDFY